MRQNTPSSPAWASEKPSDSSILTEETEDVCLQERAWYPYLDAEALGLDEGQGYVLVILPGFTDEVHFLTEIFLDVFLCGRVHHCGFDL